MSDTREPDFEALDGEAAEIPAADSRPRARLLPMWILIAAVGIVGVAWAMSERYFGESEGNKVVPLVTAEEMPVKVRPEEPGGVDVPDRDKYVYKSLTDDEPEAEQWLPPPEEPMQRPPVEVAKIPAPEMVTETPDLGSEQATLDAPEPPPPSELGVAELAAAEQSSAPVEAAEAAEESTADAGQMVEEAAQVVIAEEALEAPIEIVEADDAALSEPPPDAEAPAAPVQSAALSADSPGFLVQIGATKNEAAANGEFARLAKKHPEVLSGLGSIVIRADLGDKGVWYRMRIGPFATRGEAGGVCGQLKAVDIGCFVVAN